MNNYITINGVQFPKSLYDTMVSMVEEEILENEDIVDGYDWKFEILPEIEERIYQMYLDGKIKVFRRKGA